MKKMNNKAIKDAVYKKYCETGQATAIEYAQELGVNNFETCPRCETESPALDNECLICGNYTVGKTIDLTPTWSQLVCPMIDALTCTSLDANVEGHMGLVEEFEKMAKAADKWNEHCKKQNNG